MVKRGRSQSSNALFSALLTEDLQRQEVSILNLESQDLSKNANFTFCVGGGG